MQVWCKCMHILKLLCYGFYKDGILVLLKSVLEHWFSVCIILGLLIYLCSNPKTYVIAWLLIGIVALFAVIKAVYEIFLLLSKYGKLINTEEKEDIVELIGGRIFDIALSVVGVLQAGKILKHSIKIANATNSAFSLVDDVIAAISRVTKEFFK